MRTGIGCWSRSEPAFYTCHEVLPGMVDNGWGRIINLTGMNAIHGYKGRVPVSVAKHGLWGLTKALAKEFGPSGITVNAISPGPIRSEHDDAELAQGYPRPGRTHSLRTSG
ncbi:MAG: hypothetical protein Ct9H300mP16_01600 [Pseudomonadota bacterium]|nr:MAG: hypothetical protein Ct9H300mP16_01600 [Pseudomonadota bacterium]